MAFLKPSFRYPEFLLLKFREKTADLDTFQLREHACVISFCDFVTHAYMKRKFRK